MIAARAPVKLRGLLRFLLDPFGVLRDLLHDLEKFATARVGWIAVWLVIIAVVLVARRLLIACRDRSMRKAARRIRVLPPPEASPEQARLLWMSLHALLRPWWKRLVLGQPHIGFELVGRPEEIDLGLWVPKAVPPSLVERAIEVAFPGARTEEAEVDPIRELLVAQTSHLKA